MRTLVFIILLASVFACHQSKHDQKHEGHKHGPNESNRHMHKHDVKELADVFDNPERDAWQKPDDVISMFGDLEDKKIMDIGAGSGYFTFRLADKGAQVIAADVNDEFQEIIEKKMKELNYKDGQVELRKVPFESPDLKPEEVDGVIIVNTYHHIEQRPAYFSRVLNGLKADGMLLVVDFLKKEFKEDVPGPPLEMKLSKEQVVEELSAAGFSSFDVDTTLLPYQYIVLAKK